MRRFSHLAGALAFALVWGTANGPALGQILGQEKTILPLIKANWIAFRNFGGRQLVYFTMLQSYRCGLSEVRFSINDDGLGEYFPMPPCDPQRPNAIDTEKWPPYITMPLGTAKWAAVQLVYADGEESEPVRFGLCDAPGDSACAVVLP
ncbi:hypothetical protein MNBD_ALPHA09-1313 [hydrothermal vent metagenome]|uniref:Uncharacterized protein n=1 Tax=hydrothermal vent metagenome TaxID=652676 RepID=A0A3B0TLX1_9ZZZZ